MNGKDTGMAMQSKGKRNETSEVREGPIQSHAKDNSAYHIPTHEELRLRAYEIYLKRGGLPGNELDDWLQAERELDGAREAL